MRDLTKPKNLCHHCNMLLLRMKILIITPDIYPFQKGYGGRNPINIYDTLTEMGHKVKLLSSAPYYELDNFNIEIFPSDFDLIPLHSTITHNEDIAYLMPPSISGIAKIKHTLHEESFDLILLNDYIWSISLLSLLVMGKSNRKKTAMINHGIIIHSGSLYSPLLLIFNLAVAKIFLRDFRGVLSYSTATYKELNRFLPPCVKHLVHPLCIDSANFKSNYTRSHKMSTSEIIKDSGFSGNFIFSISSISPHKGYDILIRAFAYIQDKYSDMFLVLAGQMTQYGKGLKKFCEELGVARKVKFLGSIGDPEKFVLMRECRVFVIPSLKEGFGAGAMEADVLQIKVVATNTGAHKDILSQNSYARIVEPGNVIELQEAIEELISLKEEPERSLDNEILRKYSCRSLCEAIITGFK